MKTRIGAIFIAASLSTAVLACGEDAAQLELRIAAASSIHLVNYLGNSQNIHPKVLYFPDGWCGYNFWMAYTPYPEGKTNCENPCIAVSDDGISWDAPLGLQNPLATAPKGGYNSDTHLVFNDTEGSLECWWRVYDIKTKTDRVVRRISTDGFTWSDTEEVMPPSQVHNRLSPAIVIRDGHYVMLYSDGARMFMCNSTVEAPGIAWDEPVRVDCNYDGLNVWHQDFIMRDDNRATVVACCYGNGGNNNTADLYQLELNLDNATATTPQLLMARGKSPQSITFRSIYRSSIVNVDGTDYLYYSSIDRDWHRHLDLIIPF